MTRYREGSLAVALILIGLSGCDRKHSAPSGVDGPKLDPSVKAAILSLDHRYSEAWRRGDWETIASLVAPDYRGSGADFSWDLQKLREEFPKVKLRDYQNEPPSVKALAPGVILLSYVTRMQEIYDGRDISGRYWYSQIWVLRTGGWRLLVEQEVPLRDSP